MYFKHKIYIQFFLLILVVSPLRASSLVDQLRMFLSLNVPLSIFDDINKSIVGSLRAKNIRYMLPNKVELDQVELLDEKGQLVLSGQRVILQLSLLSLLTKNITVTNAHVIKPHFNYRIKKSIHNVIRLFESPHPKKITEKSAMRVTISYAKVEDGTFNMYHDAGVTIVAQGINGEGSLFIEDGPFGIDLSEVTVKEGSIAVAGMNLPLSNLKASDLFISNTKVFTPNLRAMYENASVKASGTVFIDKETYDIKAFIDAPKNTYPQGLAPLPFVAPAFKATIGMTGHLENPELAISADVGETEFRHLSIKKGHIETDVNRHQVLLKSSNFRVGKKGSLKAGGKVDIDHDSFAFTSTATDIASTELSRFLRIDIKTDGQLSAESSLSGNLPTKKATVFHLATKGQLRDGAIDRIQLASKTAFDLKMDFTLDAALKIHRAIISDELGLRLLGEGMANPSKNQYMISYNLRAPSLRRYAPSLIKKADAQSFFTEGHFSSQGQSIVASGKALAKQFFAQGYEVQDVKVDYIVSKEELLLNSLHAKVYEGNLNGKIIIQEFGKKNKLEGQLVINGIDIAKIAKKFSSVNIGGTAFTNIDLSGTLDDPRIIFTLELANASVDKIRVQNTQIIGEYTQDILKIPEWRSIDKAGSLVGENLTFAIKTKEIGGTFFLHDTSIALLLSQSANKSDGIISGSIHLHGTLDSPQITAPLNARNIVIYGQTLGSGILSLSLKRELLLSPRDEEDLVISLSSWLEHEKSKSSMRIGWALNKKTLNARTEFDSLLFDMGTLPSPTFPFGIQGKLTGRLDAHGPLDKLDLEAEIVADEFNFLDPAHRENTDGKLHGPAKLDIRLNKGVMDLNLCAAISDRPFAGKCVPKPGLSLSLHGPFSFLAYDLEVQATIDHDHLEQIFPYLKKELAIVSAMASIDGRLIKTKAGSPIFKSNIAIERFQASLPTVARIELNKPISFSLSNDGLSLKDQAIFSFYPGQMAINGSISTTHIDLDVQGAMPLMVARFFVPIVQRADGLAQGHIRITGSPSAPILEGRVAPERGALITFNRWLESMEVKGGEIVFKKTSKHSFRSELNNIKLSLGDGRLSLNGVLDKEYAYEQKPGKAVLDFNIEGSNVVIKDGKQFIEADFNLKTIRKEGKEPVLGGNVTITDGSAYRQFDLRNFVAQASETPKMSEVKFLDDITMKLDIEVAVRHFKAGARMLNIDIDTILTGHLRARGPIKHPKIGGGLQISEGKIIFPALTFDLQESRIDLDEDSDRIFDPKISLSSTYELEKENFPQLARDTTIELQLTGSVDRLRIELKPIRGDLKLSQTKIFLLLLMPQSLGGERSDRQFDIKRGAQNAALALSGEVFLRPLTNAFQELLGRETGTRIQFGSALEPGGITLRLSWKIGPRIEAQGSYMFLSDDNRRLGSGRHAFGADSYPLSDLKLKLLLFDHKPLGPLYFEGSFGASRLEKGEYETRSGLKLNYRVLQQ